MFPAPTRVNTSVQVVETFRIRGWGRPFEKGPQGELRGLLGKDSGKPRRSLFVGSKPLFLNDVSTSSFPEAEPVPMRLELAMTKREKSCYSKR